MQRCVGSEPLVAQEGMAQATRDVLRRRMYRMRQRAARWRSGALLPAPWR